MGNKNSLPVLFQVKWEHGQCTEDAHFSERKQEKCTENPHSSEMKQEKCTEDATLREYMYMGNTHTHTWNKNSCNSTRWSGWIVQMMRARTHGKRIYGYVEQEFWELKREDCTETANVTSGNYSSPLVSFDLFSWYARESLNIVGKQFVKIYQFAQKSTVWSVLLVPERAVEHSREKIVKIDRFAKK